MPFMTMITTASMVSRASVGSELPVSIRAEITATSMPITEIVRISVP